MLRARAAPSHPRQPPPILNSLPRPVLFPLPSPTIGSPKGGARGLAWPEAWAPRGAAGEGGAKGQDSQPSQAGRRAGIPLRLCSGPAGSASEPRDLAGEWRGGSGRQASEKRAPHRPRLRRSPVTQRWAIFPRNFPPCLRRASFTRRASEAVKRDLATPSPDPRPSPPDTARRKAASPAHFCLRLPREASSRRGARHRFLPPHHMV